MSLPVEAITHACNRHPKPDHKFAYGTAGFRMPAGLLDSVMFRMGVFAAIRSKRLDGKTIGVMVTASHNPEDDNGVKIVDPRGEMLETSWEAHATNLANAPSTDAFIKELQTLITYFKIDLERPARVLYARDTRPSGPGLIASLVDGIKAMGAEARNEGVKTTPILHYLVRCVNTKGTKEHYGDDTEEGYYQKMSEAFKKLLGHRYKPPPIVVDCANGVGYLAIEKLKPYLAGFIELIPVNTQIDTLGALNNSAGADFVKTQQKLPPSLNGKLKATQRACSLDGDADRLIYYYLDERRQFRLLDGDKIATLVAEYMVDLVKGAGLSEQITVGVVQTAYANGASTKYLVQRLPVKCVPTGVKHLHHAAEHFGIGVYFEANGHGTVLFSPDTLKLLSEHQPTSPAQETCVSHLIALSQLINQAVGDAISDMLLVEVVLGYRAYTAVEWDGAYEDMPNRLVKVQVANRSSFVTEDAERKLVSPVGLQERMDENIRKYNGGRSFVRPSGTEDVVRVYAEADFRVQADELAYKIAGIVYDFAGGAPSNRPREFLYP